MSGHHISKKYHRSRCSNHGDKSKRGPVISPTHTHKRTFKYGVEVPKKWKDIVHIAAAGNILWQDTFKKEFSSLFFHKCFDLKCSDFKSFNGY